MINREGIETELYLVQHGEATLKEENPERPLTEKGREDVTKIADFLKKCDLDIDVIWHSTKKRAIETAEILARILLPKKGIEKKEGLAPNDSVRKIFVIIEQERNNAMIVGHLPFLQKLASLALTGSEDDQIIGFRQGGVVSLQRTEERWRLVFAITPDLLT